MGSSILRTRLTGTSMMRISMKFVVLSLLTVQACCFSQLPRTQALPVHESFRLTEPLQTVALTSTLTFPVQALAAVGGDFEVAELPPPYIPVIFALALVVGVGWLTSTLGNVMDEEASLGLQSGARAKKERERSSSSYFKKK